MCERVRVNIFENRRMNCNNNRKKTKTNLNKLNTQTSGTYVENSKTVWKRIERDGVRLFQRMFETKIEMEKRSKIGI